MRCWYMVKFTSWCFQTSFHSYPHDLKKMASNSIWARKKVSNARRIVATLPSLMSLLGWCCSLQSYSFPRRWPISNVVVLDPMINLAPLGHWHVGMLSGWTLGLPWLNTTCSWTYLNLASCWCHQWGKDGHSESLLRRGVRWIRHPEAFSFCTLDTNRKICSKHGMKHVN